MPNTTTSSQVSNRPEYIFVHTAAFKGRNCDAERINQWHLDRGWSGIGYHFVILNDRHDSKADGTLESGRPIHVAGAHARGLNSRSIGICMAGHGDHDEFTDSQKSTLFGLISDLMDEYTHITLDRVIGHRELNDLIALGLVDRRFRTSKSCPGNKIDMDELREEIAIYRTMPSDAEVIAEDADEPTVDEIRAALTTLRRVSSQSFPNAVDEIRQTLSHPEILEFLEES